MNINLINLALQATGSSPLMVGRNPITTAQVASFGVLTLRDYDWLKAIENGIEKRYPIVIFDEIDDGYYSGGTQLYNLCKALDNALAKEELNKDGLKIKFEESTTKDGKRSFTRVTVMPNDD